MSLPIVLATPEALTLRPVVDVIYRIPVALGCSDYVFGCPCGWLSVDHSSHERAAKEACPVCTEQLLAKLRRAGYLAFMTAEAHAQRDGHDRKSTAVVVPIAQGRV